ncbi:MAG: MFS transporter [Spirosomataceae bacterium]
MITQTLSLYRKAYGGLSKSTWLLALVMLINRSGTMVVPFLTVYLTQSLHFSIAQAGIIMGIFGVGAVIGAYIGGILTDRFGYYLIQLWTLVLGGALFIVLGQMQTFEGITICIFLQSMVGEAFRPANAASVAFYSTPQTRTRSFSLNRLAINLGWSVGPAVGGLLASYRYEALFWVDGITCILAGVVFWFFLQPSKVTLHDDPPPPTDTAHSAYRDGIYLAFVAFVTLNALSFFQFFSTVSVYLKTIQHLAEWQIGLVMATNGLVIVFTEMLLVYQLEGKRPVLFYVAWGVGVIGTSFFLLNVFQHSTVGVVLVIVVGLTLGEMLSMPFMNSFWINRANTHNRGQYAALYTMCYSVAHIGAPLLGTQLVSHFGFEVLWNAVSVLCLCSVIGFIWLQKVLRAAEKGEF